MVYSAACVDDAVAQMRQLRWHVTLPLTKRLLEIFQIFTTIIKHQGTTYSHRGHISQAHESYFWTQIRLEAREHSDTCGTLRVAWKKRKEP